VCPHPPALIPELGAGVDGIEVVRAAATEAVQTLCAADPELVIVVGGGTARARFVAGDHGSFADYGVDLRVGLPGGDRRPSASEFPLAVLVGSWLLEKAEWSGQSRAESIPAGLPQADCLRLGAELAQVADRVGMLVMGDGAVGRTTAAPRPYDPRAEAFDRDVVAAFIAADPSVLADLDPVVAAELGVAGRAPWQVLAGAAGEALFDANILYEGAPGGVGYIVAVGGGGRGGAGGGPPPPAENPNTSKVL
jgi:hypothetical protein